MRHSSTHVFLAVALALSLGAAHAGTVDIGNDTCKSDYSTPYDVDVTPAALSFHRKDGVPAEIWLHDGAVRIDGKSVPVSAPDAEALRRYEQGVRRLMPQVAAMVREGVQMGFAAVTTVTLSFADGDQRAAMVEKLKRKQAQALREVEEGPGAGHWSSDRMAETIAGAASDSVGELVGSVTARAMTAALSGDATQVAALKARADSLDKSMDREMKKRSTVLEKYSEQLCPQINDLADLQRGWAVRQPDDKPLALMTIKPKGSNDPGKGPPKAGKNTISF